METFLNLVPLVLLMMIWSIFTFSSNLMMSLVSLLTASLVLPMIYMQYFKLFWPCSLLLILMSTGLIVIFAYITSIYSEEVKGVNPVPLLSWCVIISSTTLFLLYSNPSSKKILYMSSNITANPALSILLFSILLLLVVSFIRIVYSKGGGFRKKF